MHRSKNFVSVLVFLLVTAGVVAPSVQALSEKKTLTPIANSRVESDNPDRNMGSRIALVAEETVREMLSFLMFDLAEIPSGAVIGEARLRLYGSGGADAPERYILVGVHYCPSSSWTEDGITYNNKPAYSENPVDTANVTVGMAWFEWNLTDTVKSKHEAADKRLSLVLKAETYGTATFDTRTTGLYSQPVEDTRPQLVVSYEAPPPSGVDPTLATMIVIAAIGAVSIGLGLSYVILKGRKHKSSSALQFKTAQKSTLGCFSELV